MEPSLSLAVIERRSPLMKMVVSNGLITMPIVAVLWISVTLSLISDSSTFVTHGFSIQPQRQTCPPNSCPSSHTHWQTAPTIHHNNHHHRHRSTCLSVIGAGAASLLAGSVGGAIGVGVAYPLDTLKTKSQVYGQQRTQQRKEQQQQQTSSSSQTTTTINDMQPLILDNNSTTAAMPLSTTATGVVCTKEDCYPVESPEDDLISLVKLILEVEGIAGFFGGVKAMMIGQALIKSVAFSANAMALSVLVDSNLLGSTSSSSAAGMEEMGGAAAEVAATSFLALLLAASFSGFVTSFLVAPVERVKVMMQAQQNSLYANELECIQAVLQNEGWTGLFSRGLGPTLAREVPSYAIYFVVYGTLMQTPTAESLGSVAPLLCGAISGCACWIPVYPVDVVKTLVQNTEGGEEANPIDVAMQLYQDEGIGAFFNGLTPKMLRASVNHAVTFWVYDLMMGVLV
mmetsp:Transcript_3987/g.8821  ORF Transcript_3987/g.8821 Transcript_3987/m.8821 type:complete len:456 (-) Transcript_3987:127-1494(-)